MAELADPTSGLKHSWPPHRGKRSRTRQGAKNVARRLLGKVGVYEPRKAAREDTERMAAFEAALEALTTLVQYLGPEECEREGFAQMELTHVGYDRYRPVCLAEWRARAG